MIYEAIDKRINELLKKSTYKCEYVILMRAILINSETDMSSFIEVKRFDIINLKTGKRSNYLKYFNA